MKHLIPYTLLLALFLTGNGNAVAQRLPNEMTLSPDGRMLLSGTKRVTGFYDTTAIKDIKLYFTQSDFLAQLTANKAQDKDLGARMVYEGKTYNNVGVSFKGNTSYSGVRNQDKKSFGITLDFVDPNQDLDGYQTLNLNNAYQDASMMREVVYGMLSRRHNPGVRTNFVHLYLNDVDWGVYPNIQQVNGEFIKDWWFSNDGARWRAETPPGAGGVAPPPGGGGGGGGFGTGRSGLNFLGADTTLYKAAYNLKSSKVSNPWRFLALTAEKLNQQTPAQLEATINDYLDLDRALWFIATENMFVDDDSYINKGGMDYYVYYDPETNRITPIETDGNSAIALNRATSWSPFFNATNANYPLMTKLLAVPAFRQRYLAHIRTINEEIINPAVSHPLINALARQIDALVKDDPKALYTYAAFQTEVNNLKTYFTNRYNYIKAFSEVARIVPSITKTAYASGGSDWTPPTDKATVTVRSSVSSTEGISAVWLYYSPNLVGKFTKIAMRDDGKSGDGAANDGVFGAEIPAQAGGSYVRYYIEAVSANSVNTVSYDPVGAEHNVYIYQVKPNLPATRTVVLNELEAANTKILDENKQADDWIELYNLTTSAIDLSGYYLSDNPTNLKKWVLPKNTSIPAKDYLIVWADEDGSQGPLHASFKLSQSGEAVYLSNPSGELVDQVTFGAQQDDMGFARYPNGTGAFRIQAPTFKASNGGQEDPNVTNPNTGLVLAVSSSNDQLLRVFPNPASDQVVVTVPISLLGQSLRISDALGRLLHEQRATTENRISTGQWAAGFYLIRVGEQTAKVLVR
jgi:hypothetical protein